MQQGSSHSHEQTRAHANPSASSDGAGRAVLDFCAPATTSTMEAMSSLASAADFCNNATMDLPVFDEEDGMLSVVPGSALDYRNSATSDFVIFLFCGIGNARMVIIQ